MHFGQWIMREYYVLTTSQKVSCILYIPLAQGSSNDVTYNCALSSSKKTADLALSLVLTAKHWAEEAEEELITITSKLIIIYIDYIKSIFIIIIINK